MVAVAAGAKFVLQCIQETAQLTFKWGDPLSCPHPQVHDAVIAVGDDELRLGEAGWTLNAFIDDTEKLVRTVAKGIIRSAAIDNNLVKVAAKSAAGVIKKRVAAKMGRASSSASLPGGRVRFHDVTDAFGRGFSGTPINNQKAKKSCVAHSTTSG